MIRFLLDAGNGRIDDIRLGDEVPADLTVLDWLRLHRRLTGTKEGCGSGDCGACTVVVASPADAGLVHESVNACIAFVGALHGRLLVTVESLARGDTLHPVQQAMVDEHGSQCGFCTPGFVMSLYALYRAPDAPRVTFAGAGSSDAATERANDPPPKGLDEPTPVVAYRSAANAEAALASIDADALGVDGRGGQHGEHGEHGEDGEHGRGGRGGSHASTLPMTVSTGWSDGFATADRDVLSHRVDRVLGGNLCRCTGYRPIKRAAAAALAARAVDPEAGTALRERERDLADRLREIAAVPPEHAGFHAPNSLESFAALVERHPDAPLLGGGTDLALEVTQKLRDLPRLIHVAQVPELSVVETETDGEDGKGDVLSIGAAVSLTRCMALLGERVPGASELLLRFGSDPVRNRGTIGGNIASASPIGDLPPLLLALGATLVLQKGGTVRTLPLDDFFTGYRETRLARGEFLRAVRVPLPGPDDVCAVYKVSKRMEDDISAVCGAFRLTLDDERRIVAARIAFGGMAATPARARAAEAALGGAMFERAAIDRAADALDEDFAPMSDARASAGYRARVARNLLRRLLLESGGGAPVRLSLADSPGHAPGSVPGPHVDVDAARGPTHPSGDAHGER